MRYYLISICFLFVISCSPKMLDVKQAEPIKFEKTEEYKLDLSKIPKPDPLKSLIGVVQDTNGTIQVLDVESLGESKQVMVLTPEEFQKIAQLVNLAVTYKQIVLQQTDLINENINTSNSLKEFVEIERLKSDAYNELWVASENQYRQEAYERRNDNFVNKAIQLFLSCGILVVAVQ